MNGNGQQGLGHGPDGACCAGCAQGKPCAGKNPPPQPVTLPTPTQPGGSYIPPMPSCNPCNNGPTPAQGPGFVSGAEQGVGATVRPPGIYPNWIRPYGGPRPPNPPAPEYTIIQTPFPLANGMRFAIRNSDGENYCWACAGHWAATTATQSVVQQAEMILRSNAPYGDYYIFSNEGSLFRFYKAVNGYVYAWICACAPGGAGAGGGNPLPPSPGPTPQPSVPLHYIPRITLGQAEDEDGGCNVDQGKLGAYGTPYHGAQRGVGARAPASCWRGVHEGAAKRPILISPSLYQSVNGRGYGPVIDPLIGASSRDILLDWVANVAPTLPAGKQLQTARLADGTLIAGLVLRGPWKTYLNGVGQLPWPIHPPGTGPTDFLWVWYCPAPLNLRPHITLAGPAGGCEQNTAPNDIAGAATQCNGPWLLAGNFCWVASGGHGSSSWNTDNAQVSIPADVRAAAEAFLDNGGARPGAPVSMNFVDSVGRTWSLIEIYSMSGGNYFNAGTVYITVFVYLCTATVPLNLHPHINIYPTPTSNPDYNNPGAGGGAPNIVPSRRPALAGLGTEQGVGARTPASCWRVDQGKLGAYGTPYHSPDEVKQYQRDVGSKTSVIDASVKTCTSLDQPTRAGWGAFYAHCQEYAHRDVPSTINIFDLRAMWEEGLALKGQTEEWAAKLDAAGCNVPVVAPPQQKTLTDALITLAKIAGGIAVAGGVVWLTLKGVEVWNESKAFAPPRAPAYTPPSRQLGPRPGHRAHPAFAEAGSTYSVKTTEGVWPTTRMRIEETVGMKGSARRLPDGSVLLTWRVSSSEWASSIQKTLRSYGVSAKIV